MELIRGDSEVLVFSILDDDDKIIGLELIDTLILTARETPSEKSRVLFTKNKEDFSIVDGEYNVELLPTDTEQLKLNKFNFDIEVTLKDGTRKTSINQVKLTKDYTIHGGDNND